MKGCLVLQRRFAYIGHELAVLLKERGVIQEFCAFVQTRDSFDFLQSQRDLHYSALLLDEDVQKSYVNGTLDMEYLRTLERKYGMPNLWRFLNVDRIIRYGQLVREYPYDTSPYAYEEMLRIAQAYGKKIEAFLEAEKPDFIFMYQPGALGTVLLYAMAKKRGIPVIVMINPMTRDLIAFSEKYERFTWIEEIFENNKKKNPSQIPQYQESKRFIDEFRAAPTVYSPVHFAHMQMGRAEQLNFLLPRNIMRALRWIRRMVGEWLHNRKKQTDYSERNPLYYLWDSLKRKFRNLVGAETYYDPYDRQTPFVFYPLHVEPEISVMLLSPFDTDQITLVRRLAISLPVGMLVYVKEHPHMVQYRPMRFYKELKKIPNVRLIRPEVPSFELIRHCELVGIISGTAGWEASILGKPVITFGEVFYNALSSVARSRTPEELPMLVKQQLGKKVDEEEVRRFVAALFEDCARGDLLHIWEDISDAHAKRESLQNIADTLAKKIALVTAKSGAR